MSKLPPLVPPLLPPATFCELSPASRLFSTNLAMIIFQAALSNVLMTDVPRMQFVDIKKDQNASDDSYNIKFNSSLNSK